MLKFHKDIYKFNDLKSDHLVFGISNHFIKIIFNNWFNKIS